MWLHATDLNGMQLEATDGDLGSVSDLYFDDDRWTGRYLVVNTGNWLTGQLVLVSPHAVTAVDRERRRIEVSLTRAQVEQSPPIDAHRPVSRQSELAYASYYGYPLYWSGPGLWGAEGTPAAIAGLTAIERRAAEQIGPTAPEDSHLRSAREVAGYSIEATDGDIGRVQDFVLHDRSWAIRLLVVDTSSWWLGRKVLMSPDWIRDIGWADRVVHVAVSREAVRSSPEWDKRAPIDEQVEATLRGHYQINAASK